mgnify:CR=1 FL=1
MVLDLCNNINEFSLGKFSLYSRQNEAGSVLGKTPPHNSGDENKNDELVTIFKYCDDSRGGTALKYNQMLSVMEQSPRDDVYGFTLGYNDNHKLAGIPLKDHDDNIINEYIMDIMKRSNITHGSKKDKVKVHMMMFPEYSERGRLHWHGIVWNCCPYWPASIKKMLIRKKFCNSPGLRLELKLTSKHSWFKYMTKDYRKSGLKYPSYCH